MPRSIFHDDDGRMPTPDPSPVWTRLNAAVQWIRAHPSTPLQYPWWMRALLLIPHRVRAVLKRWIPREYRGGVEQAMTREVCLHYTLPIIRGGYTPTTINVMVTVAPLRPPTPPADLWAAPFHEREPHV